MNEFVHRAVAAGRMYIALIAFSGLVPLVLRGQTWPSEPYMPATGEKRVPYQTNDIRTVRPANPAGCTHQEVALVLASRFHKEWSNVSHDHVGAFNLLISQGIVPRSRWQLDRIITIGEISEIICQVLAPGTNLSRDVAPGVYLTDAELRGWTNRTLVHAFALLDDRAPAVRRNWKTPPIERPRAQTFDFTGRWECNFTARPLRVLRLERDGSGVASTESGEVPIRWHRTPEGVVATSQPASTAVNDLALTFDPIGLTLQAGRAYFQCVATNRVDGSKGPSSP